MSELKVYRISGIEFDSQFYHKSEADKVIEEKDEKIRNLKRSLCVARHEVARTRGKNSSNKYRAKFKEVK